MMTDHNPQMTTLEKLHSETAMIAWKELQRFFAQGVVMQIDAVLDLVEVAVLFAEDNAEELEAMLRSGKVAAPTVEQARDWFDRDVMLWSVVVAPFVLVQDKPQ